MEVYQIPVLSDNYIYLLRDENVNFTAVVDPALSEPVKNLLQLHDWKLDAIINTHHHADHIGGNLELKEIYNCKIYGFKQDATRIPGITDFVEDNQLLKLGTSECQILFAPGHTLGHICYYFADEKLLFCGDTLFSFGCGRLFEGTPAQMLNSLKKIRALPDDTQFCCAHEYTLNNIEFALSIENNNVELANKAQEIKKLRQQNLPTVPSTLKTQKELSPFLRWDDSKLADALGLLKANELEVFTAVRKKRDQW